MLYQDNYFVVSVNLINGLECTVQIILVFLNTLFEIHMKSKK